MSDEIRRSTRKLLAILQSNLKREPNSIFTNENADNSILNRNVEELDIVRNRLATGSEISRRSIMEAEALASILEYRDEILNSPTNDVESILRRNRILERFPRDQAVVIERYVNDAIVNGMDNAEERERATRRNYNYLLSAEAIEDWINDDVIEPNYDYVRKILIARGFTEDQITSTFGEQYDYATTVDMLRPTLVPNPDESTFIAVKFSPARENIDNEEFTSLEKNAIQHNRNQLLRAVKKLPYPSQSEEREDLLPRLTMRAEHIQQDAGREPPVLLDNDAASREIVGELADRIIRDMSELGGDDLRTYTIMLSNPQIDIMNIPTNSFRGRGQEPVGRFRIPNIKRYTDSSMTIDETSYMYNVLDRLEDIIYPETVDENGNIVRQRIDALDNASISRIRGVIDTYTVRGSPEGFIRDPSEAESPEDIERRARLLDRVNELDQKVEQYQQQRLKARLTEAGERAVGQYGPRVKMSLFSRLWTPIRKKTRKQQLVPMNETVGDIVPIPVDSDIEDDLDIIADFSIASNSADRSHREPIIMTVKKSTRLRPKLYTSAFVREEENIPPEVSPQRRLFEWFYRRRKPR